MMSCHFLKTRKLETENVHLNQVFSIRLLILFLLHFKCIGLQTLGGLAVTVRLGLDFAEYLRLEHSLELRLDFGKSGIA